MSVCLPKEITDAFKKALKEGVLEPGKLAEMTSEQRRAEFAKVVGEQHAEWVNSKFEAKLLLKNFKAGAIDWARTVAGMKPEVRRDIIAKIERLDRVLSPESEKAFLADLAAQKLGVGITYEEAGQIARLSRETAAAKEARDAGGSREPYGKARTSLEKYVKGLSTQSTLEHFKEKPVQAVAGTAKSLKASLDDSAIFRQGWRTMFTHPGIWMKNSVKTFSDLARTLGGKAVEDEVRADIVSRPNYERMEKAKLAVGTVEEAYPEGVVEKIPALGRLYKASENAYTGFVHRVRADVFDKYIDIAQKAGIDINDVHQLESIGKLVNSLTGRGDLGRLEKVADVVNNVFFSPRAFKATVDTLTLHAGDNLSSFARKQAAKNLGKQLVGMAAIITIANVIAPGSAETDPRSADFGKIKIGNTRFDVTGGMASFATLVSRILSGSSKSSTTGQVSKINSGKFGSQTGSDVVYQFMENKFSPAMSTIWHVLNDEGADGKKPTLGGELENLFVPLPITNYLELKNDPDSAPKLLGLMADALGISTNTYGSNSETSKIQKAIREANDSKQEGGTPASARSIAQGLYGDKPTAVQLSDVAKQVAFAKKFGYDDKFANVLNNATNDTQRFTAIQNAKEELSAEDFKKFYSKARSEVTLASGNTSPVLISDSFDKRYRAFEKGDDFKLEKGASMSDQDVAQRNLFSLVAAYAKAYGTDPDNAFKAMFTKETLGKVEGNLVELQRFGGIPYNAKGGSEEYSKQLLERMGIPWSKHSDYKLEHIVPVDAGGGSFDPDNLVMVPNREHNSYTPFDVAVGNAVKAKRMTRKEGAELSRRLKVDKSITVDAAIRLTK